MIAIPKQNISEHGNPQCSKCMTELCLDKKANVEKLEKAGWIIKNKKIYCKKCKQ